MLTAPLPAAHTLAFLGHRVICDPSGVLYFPDLSLLVVSDLHLEKGSSYARRGALLPPYDTGATLTRLAAAIARFAPQTVISLGDSFHDGGGAARLPLPFRLQLETMMAGRGWFWVAGNHDPDIPADLPGDAVREVAIAGLIFRHEPTRNAPAGEISGHLHPAARIVQRGRSVRRRCFAVDGERLIMPAFGAFTGSLNILDRAYAGLFRREALMAYLLGDDRVYPIGGAALKP